MRRCKSTNIGDIGEARAIYEFTKLEIPVSRPLSNNLPYDLIIDCLGKLFKVQVKTRSCLNDSRMNFDVCQNNAFTGEHFLYSDSDVDLFFLYCIEVDICCLMLKSDIYTQSVSLRLDNCTPLNNQKSKIRYVSDYTIEKTLLRLGYTIV